MSQNSNSTMKAIAQIEGVQDIILSKLPPSSLPLMVCLSTQWVKPSLSHAHAALEQMSGEFITTLNVWEKKRTTTRQWWENKRRTHDFEGVPVHDNKVARLTDDFLSRNKRGNSARFKRLHEEYINQCTKLSILKLKLNDVAGEEYWTLQYSHKIYAYTEPLFRTRHKLECMREELVKLFRITLHSSQHPRPGTPGPIGLFHGTARPDLMLLRLAALTHLLQKT